MRVCSSTMPYMNILLLNSGMTTLNDESAQTEKKPNTEMKCHFMELITVL